jgi:hypothetical protein
MLKLVSWGWSIYKTYRKETQHRQQTILSMVNKENHERTKPQIGDANFIAPNEIAEN